MNKIKLGMIGLSAGNGHPYSWSAIINGYDPIVMADCPFPVILDYLSKEKFPEARIAHAAVTHIWTQDRQISEHIAKATYIPNVLDKLEDMIVSVDGILLARDDAEHHVEMAKPFLEAGLPIYIDKPLALTRQEAEYLFSLQHYPGQLFTCSAFQYARELNVIDKEFADNIVHIDAYIKNDWDKYAIHLIEPILKIIGYEQGIDNVHVQAGANKVIANYLFENGLTLQIKTLRGIDIKPSIHFFKKDKLSTIIFEDTFFAFKNTLEKFIENMKAKKNLSQKEFVLRCIEMLERVNWDLKGKLAHA